MHNIYKAGYLPTAVMMALIAVFALLSYQRNIIWDDSLSLWSDIVKKSPMKARAHFNLATVVVGTGDYDRALKENMLALKLNPSLAGAHFNIGAINHVRGNLEVALRRYQISIALKPDVVKVHNNLGVIYFTKGLDAMALKEFNTAIAIDPFHAKTYFSRGNLYLETGSADLAYADYQRTLDYKPDFAEAILYSGIALERMGRFEEAGQMYRLAGRHESTGKHARQKLAELYSNQNWGDGIRYEARPRFSRPQP